MARTLEKKKKNVHVFFDDVVDALVVALKKIAIYFVFCSN